MADDQLSSDKHESDDVFDPLVTPRKLSDPFFEPVIMTVPQHCQCSKDGQNAQSEGTLSVRRQILRHQLIMNNRSPICAVTNSAI
jgi:hypothetical protein